MNTFHDRWLAARSAFGPACVGIDPHAALLEAWGLPDTPGGLETFAQGVLEAVVDVVGVVKPQAAFFERHGSAGMAVLERLLVDARSAGLLTLLDAKRGDIGSTAAAYGDALFTGPCRADAATMTPYLGVEALAPAVETAAAVGAAVVLVTQSSNPEGRRLQRAEVQPGTSVQQDVVQEATALVAARGLSAGSLGFVVSPASGGAVEVDLPAAAVILCPGLGAQGLSAAEALTAFPADRRESVVLAASRSVLQSGPSLSAVRDSALALQHEAGA